MQFCVIKLLIGAFVLQALACVGESLSATVGGADDETGAAQKSPTASPAQATDKSYLDMWKGLDAEKKARMMEYMKVRGGNPWRFIRCEACKLHISRFVSDVATVVSDTASGCEASEAVKEKVATPLCSALLNNETDLLVEWCVDDFSRNCVKIVAAVASSPAEDAEAACNETPMCKTAAPKKSPSSSPSSPKAEKNEAEL